MADLGEIVEEDSWEPSTSCGCQGSHEPMQGAHDVVAWPVEHGRTLDVAHDEKTGSAAAARVESLEQKVVAAVGNKVAGPNLSLPSIDLQNKDGR